MEKFISLSLMLLGTAIISQMSLANNPTNGYCQTVDPSVCGWGASAPAQARWFIAVAFDPITGAYAASSGTEHQIALRHAYKTCRSINVVDGKQKRCSGSIKSDSGSSSNTTPFVLARGQREDGQYGFNIRYNGYGTSSFWPQDSKNLKVSEAQAAMDDCQYRFNLKNCTLVISY
ncbi:hypothetical protein G9F32_11610 [Acinetobacter sp. 194]|uniref:hypothetical protein n=1 Tax=Acinetobacter shaoyimingii TaxID=2715164 RepID=UPI00140735E2|nr:hypothetical protein [Acinetobacter shaoyimingii]NHB58655.1 hypothetical protein [Acinetobacter shaoyimingii]